MKDYVGQTINLQGDSYLNPAWPGHTRNVNQITSISVHHNAIQRPHDYDSVAMYRNEAASHYQNLGLGLQYHYTIDNVGQVYVIRPHTTWLHVVGSAENVTCLAICLDGNFENQQPTREQFEALYQLLENLCEQHPEFPATWPDVRPHADYSSTACCGANLRGLIYPIKDKASAQSALLNKGDYDWPQYQNVPTLPPPAPVIPTPTPPSVVITYRVFKDGKQIGAYTQEKNAYNKYKAEGGKIVDQNNNDVTAQLVAKYDPPTEPVPNPPVVDQTHDYGQETNSLVKQILDIIKKIATWLHVPGVKE